MTTKQVNIVTIGCYYCQKPLLVDEEVVMAECKECFGKHIRGMAGKVTSK